jgi:hypothetical protein
MLEDAKIIELAKQAASANLGAQALESVRAEPIVDSEGRDALRITVIIKPGRVEGLSGNKLLNTLYQIQYQLSLAGEERLAVVDYSTKKELEQSGATQS